ncbi:MAG: DDE transposase family protein [Cyanobacteriota bacterium]|nr:DDE transposase family protein [Cyanobacteriota bacterium]
MPEPTSPLVWMIVQQPDGRCLIHPYPEDVAGVRLADPASHGQQWGPFVSEQEAIVRRVGLIRAGKCLPL